MKRIAAVVAALLMLPMADGPAVALPQGLVATRVASLEFPTGMQWTASGDRLFVNERGGRVRLIRNGRLIPQPVAEIATTTGAESGLLGLALHPRFEQGEGWLYVFHTLPGGGRDRVVRLRIQEGRSVEQQVVMDGLPAGGYHHGGILAFAPDGTLFVSHGEYHDDELAQRPRVLGGKIYRLMPNGDIPPDNPFSGSPTFAYGIRNPFGLCVDPESGLLWETENGPNSHDEINIIERGRNYGWPRVRGRAGDSRFVDPVKDYPDIIVPTMCAFGPEALGDAAGDFYFGSFGDEAIRRLTPTANRRGVAREQIFHKPGSGVVGMAAGPDGLYYTTPEGVFRIAPQRAQATTPPASASPTSSSPSPEPTSTPAGGRGLGTIFGLLILIAAGLGGTLLSMWIRKRQRAARR